MPSNIISTNFGDSPDGPSVADDTLTQRRLRHITSIQVRNLTPFPVRDAFASALTQPSARPQFAPHGHLSDDLDITLGRKRGRKISTASVQTSRSFKSDVVDEHPPVQVCVEAGFRRRNLSKASVSGAVSASIGSSSSPPSARRPPQRRRTSSAASYTASRRSESFSKVSTVGSANSGTLPQVFSDHSQTALERVVNSRLVETFVTVSVPRPRPLLPIPPLSVKSTRSDTPPQTPSLSPLRSAPSTNGKSHRKGVASVSSGKSAARSSISAASSPVSRSAKDDTLPRASTSLKRSHSKSSSMASPSISKHASPPSIPIAFPGSTNSPLAVQCDLPPVPNYISPIHRPSINPSFSLDTFSNPDVAGQADLSLGKMKVELWGRIGTGWGINSVGKGKGKEKDMSPLRDGEGLEWKILEHWDVNLSELIPLPDHIVAHPSHLPSNTLLVHLSPPDQTFYLPVSSPSRPSSRPSTPTVGHSSDPEIDSSEFPTILEGLPSLALTRIRHSDTTTRLDYWDSSRGRRESLETAGWQDFVKLTTLQAVIADTKKSLSDIEHKIDQILSHDKVSILKREISERETWISDLRLEREMICRYSEELKARIQSRKADMRQRREALLQATKLLGQELEGFAEMEDLLHQESDYLTSLRTRLVPTRTTLLTTLSGIFPIDLLSPPDLLYSILFVPLPIPLSLSDPAPPLSLSSQKEVTEDGVATALGFAAQVVHLMAFYLGKVLVYPITCVGSRSLIKDGISAMVGPRMFPLFSKGVDTYRFEYGVFLLNKNIEMLMADRNLRALDMRHTLPNLKNLLLTLTDGEGAQLSTVQPLNSPAVSGLQSPRMASPPEIKLTQNTPESPQYGLAEEAGDPDSPSASGSTTPTNASVERGRKSRAFLDLSPLAGFLRLRYSPSIRTSTSPELADVRSDNGTPEAGTELVLEEVNEGELTPAVNVKSEANGHVNGNTGEKYEEEEESETPTMPRILVK